MLQYTLYIRYCGLSGCAPCHYPRAFASRHGKIFYMLTKRPARPFLVRWGPALFLMSLIFILSSIPSRSLPDFGTHDLLVKKLSHAAGYALLAASIYWGWGSYDLRNMCLAWVLTLVYAISDELHQSFVPGRMSSLVDVGIDAAGAIAGVLAYHYLLLHSFQRQFKQIR